jgi:glutamate/aspartate transport system substrate-binding protein
MAERIVDDLKKVTGNPNLKINYQVITSQNRIPLLQNGTIDFECGSTTNNAGRQKDAAFAVTTFVDEVRTAVKANSGIKSVADLNGKTVVTTTGTTSCAAPAPARARRQHRLQDSARQGPRRQLFAAGIRPCRRFRDGRLHPGGQHRASKNPKDFAIVGEALSFEPIACMLRKDDPKMKRPSTIPSSARSRTARWPSCTTSGSCSRFRRPTHR